MEAAAERVTEYTYDATGNLLTITRPALHQSPPHHTRSVLRATFCFL
ncbi:MAG: RHS repeat protein [Desulfosarcina sp.]|nr:RHS repeat protein [Desulfosarcina sp.]